MSIVGSVVLVAGIAMIVLPGPAILAIPAGLAILATQFRWARKVLDEVWARLPGRDDADGEGDRRGSHRQTGAFGGGTDVQG
ncbi:MAG: PGPGW domain-containing protein [Actinomycetota bacterium]|nr:PGPGW domain-containing protein [Actinomycetota bacterium]